MPHFTLAGLAGRDANAARQPVHVHDLDPVAEAVDDHPPHDHVVGVERVSAPRVVGVPRAVAFEHVVRLVVDPAEAQGRPLPIALGGVANSVLRLEGIVDRVTRRMRKAKRLGRTVTLRLRFEDFARVTRSHTLVQATAQTLTAKGV